MQIWLAERELLVGVTKLQSIAVEVAGYSLATLTLVGHDLSGTSPRLEVTLLTSDDLEDWVIVATGVSLTSAGIASQALKAGTAPWGRYARAEVSLSGTDPMTVYSLALGLFTSS